MKIRTLIVDDEPLARERLRALLSKAEDFEVVGEAADGATALDLVREEKPDLVFLDIQMPEMNGFEVLERCPKETMPWVVFVTAYDTFAVKAFEVHAVDYLLKPVDRERFAAALQRVRSQVAAGKPGEGRDRLEGLLGEVRSKGEGVIEPLDRLAVKSAGRVLVVKVEKIDWVEAADNYVTLHMGTESIMHRETMASMEKRLPSGRFVRISRSSLVNVDRIRELQPLFHGDYTVVLATGAKLTASRTYRDRLEQFGLLG